MQKKKEPLKPKCAVHQGVKNGFLKPKYNVPLFNVVHLCTDLLCYSEVTISVEICFTDNQNWHSEGNADYYVYVETVDCRKVRRFLVREIFSSASDAFSRTPRTMFSGAFSTKLGELRRANKVS